MRIRTWSLLLTLGLQASFTAYEVAIAPLVAKAYTSRVNITLERQPNESYQTLTRRAEAVARAAAQRSFDNDILVTEATVVVTGQHIGLSAPILILQVSRDNWKNFPDSQRWSTYYPNSKALLRIDDPTPVAVATPQSTQRPEPTLGTGTIQTTLRWSTTDDLDLIVIDPNRKTVFFQNKRIPSGGQLDVDSNAGCQNTITNPVENIFWPATGAPPGNYVVLVNLYQRCGTRTGPISFRLRLLVKGTTKELTGTVDDANKTVSFPFSISANGTPQLPTGPAPITPGNTPTNPPTNRPGTGNPRPTPAPTTPRNTRTNRSGTGNEPINVGANSGQVLNNGNGNVVP